MTITHDETDTMIIQQMASVGSVNVLVLVRKSDVCSLFVCHFVFNGDITRHVMMISPIRRRTVIDIKAKM